MMNCISPCVVTGCSAEYHIYTFDKITHNDLNWAAKSPTKIFIPLWYIINAMFDGDHPVITQ